MRWLLRTALVVAGVWLALCALVWLLQRKMQYFPSTEELAPFGGAEDVTLETADGVRLRAWYWPGARDTVLLVFHGNAGDRSDRVGWMAPLLARGWGVFLLDYRGYGGSGGSPTEEGLYRDADAAADFLAARGVGKTVYVGESIGCGVAVDLASRRPPAALVLQSGAVSLADVGREAYPWLPIGLLMKDRYDAGARIGRVAAPALFIHGTADTTIPMRLGRALFDAKPLPKEWYEVEGADHNDVSFVAGDAYYERVHAFLERATRDS